MLTVQGSRDVARQLLHSPESLAVTAAGAPHLFLCRAPPQPSFLSHFKSQQASQTNE